MSETTGEEPRIKGRYSGRSCSEKKRGSEEEEIVMKIVK
jgi:hypothetical protein